MRKAREPRVGVKYKWGRINLGVQQARALQSVLFQRCVAGRSSVSNIESLASPRPADNTNDLTGVRQLGLEGEGKRSEDEKERLRI